MEEFSSDSVKVPLPPNKKESKWKPRKRDFTIDFHCESNSKGEI
jgi:hypothetical protein